MNEELCKVLFLSGVKGDTRRYRTFHPYEQLRLAGVDCQLSHITDPRLPEKASRAGVVILHRVAMDRYVESLLADWQQRGALLILDVDDLVFEPQAFQWINSPDFADPLRAALYQEEMHRQRLIFDACQAVIASTEFLAGHVRQQGKPVWVHRNAFSLEMVNRAEAAYRSAPGPAPTASSSAMPAAPPHTMRILPWSNRRSRSSCCSIPRQRCGSSGLSTLEATGAAWRRASGGFHWFPGENCQRPSSSSISTWRRW